jgi:hypothetical protein
MQLLTSQIPLPAPNLLFGTFIAIKCIAGDVGVIFGPAVQACGSFDHRHIHTPSTWKTNPPCVRGPQPQNDSAARIRQRALLRDAMPLREGHLGLPKSRRRGALGPFSLVETLKQSILTQIEPDFLWTNRPLDVGRIADALDVDIVSHIKRESVYSELTESQRTKILGCAPGDLPLHLWEALLTSYVCGICFRLTSSCGRRVHFNINRTADASLSAYPVDSVNTIVADACSECVILPLADRASHQ